MTSAAVSTSFPTIIVVRDGNGWTTVGHKRRVRLQDLNLLAVEPERVRGNLREDGVCSLAHLRATSENVNFAIGRCGDLSFGCEIFFARTGEPRTMEKSGEADTAFDRVARIFFREPGPLLVIAAQFERAVQQFVHFHFFVDHLADGKRLAFTNEIAAAQFFRRETDGSGHSIEMPLQSENTLRRAKAAKSSMWRSIGGHDATLNQNVGTGVRAGGVNRASGQYYGRKRFVRPAVECEINLHGQKFPLARDGRAVTRARRMPFRGRGHIFGAVVNHFHRLAGFQREQSSVARDHRGVFFFAAEAAAGLCLYHAHSFLGQAE